jgi:hypothetical protein
MEARKKEGRNRTKEKSTQALADRPARRGGLSARATRTVRPAAADRPHPHRELSGRAPWTVRKSNRNLQRRPRITDCPRGARGLSARHPRTVQNRFQPKFQTKTDRKQSRARTRRTREEHCARGPSARPPWTVRQARKSTLPIHHRISQTVEAVETRVWGHEKCQPRMLYPKIFSS